MSYGQVDGERQKDLLQKLDGQLCHTALSNSGIPTAETVQAVLAHLARVAG
jgi:hypothetical protein